MIRIDVVTTRGGDSGDTSLGDGTRVRKDAARVEALGAVDECNAAVGLLRLHTADEAAGEHDAMLARVQNDLFDLGADLAVPSDDPRARLRVGAAHLLRLEGEVAAMNAALPPLTSFVLPGGTAAGAHAHLARTLARRAERAVVRLAGEEGVNPDAVRYLNRLSDHFFVLSRAVNAGRDVLWVPGGSAGGA